MSEKYPKQVITEEDMNLFKQINIIKYKKKVRLVKLSIAVGLVLCIGFFYWNNFSYAKEINKIRSEYGSNAYCYLCGYENLRSCGCIYEIKITGQQLQSFKENLGDSNIKDCKPSNSGITSIPGVYNISN